MVPTDDFAVWNEPLDWWPRMLTEVIEPLADGRPARYQRRDFATGALLDWDRMWPSSFSIYFPASASYCSTLA
jgi:hypothetical protein